MNLLFGRNLSVRPAELRLKSNFVILMEFIETFYKKIRLYTYYYLLKVTTFFVNFLALLRPDVFVSECFYNIQSNIFGFYARLLLFLFATDDFSIDPDWDFFI